MGDKEGRVGVLAGGGIEPLALLEFCDAGRLMFGRLTGVDEGGSIALPVRGVPLPLALPLADESEATR